MRRHRRKDEAECQTVLQCTPHILRVGDRTVVQSIQQTQTIATVSPRESDNELYPQLELIDKTILRKDAVRICKARRHRKLQFRLPEEMSITSSATMMTDFDDDESEVGSRSFNPFIVAFDEYPSYAARSSLRKISFAFNENLNDKEIQTRLMVFPHLLRYNERASVVTDISVQTSVTCQPKCSLTEIIPKLKAYLEHEGREMVVTGDSTENRSILDIIRGIIRDVENSHKYMFDNNYRPPVVPDALKHLDKNQNKAEKTCAECSNEEKAKLADKVCKASCSKKQKQPADESIADVSQTTTDELVIVETFVPDKSEATETSLSDVYEATEETFINAENLEVSVSVDDPFDTVELSADESIEVTTQDELSEPSLKTDFDKVDEPTSDGESFTDTEHSDDKKCQPVLRADVEKVDEPTSGGKSFTPDTEHSDDKKCQPVLCAVAMELENPAPVDETPAIIEQPTDESSAEKQADKIEPTAESFANLDQSADESKPTEEGFANLDQSADESKPTDELFETLEQPPGESVDIDDKPEENEETPPEDGNKTPGDGDQPVKEEDFNCQKGSACGGFKIKLFINNIGTLTSSDDPTQKTCIELNILPGLQKIEVKAIEQKEEESPIQDDNECTEDCCILERRFPGKTRKNFILPDGRTTVCPAIIYRVSQGGLCNSKESILEPEIAQPKIADTKANADDEECICASKKSEGTIENDNVVREPVLAENAKPESNNVKGEVYDKCACGSDDKLEGIPENKKVENADPEDTDPGCACKSNNLQSKDTAENDNVNETPMVQSETDNVEGDSTLENEIVKSENAENEATESDTVVGGLDVKPEIGDPKITTKIKQSQIYCEKTRTRKKISRELLTSKAMSICNLLEGNIMALVSKSTEGFSIILNIKNPNEPAPTPAKYNANESYPPKDPIDLLPCICRPITPTSICKCDEMNLDPPDDKDICSNDEPKTPRNSINVPPCICNGATPTPLCKCDEMNLDLPKDKDFRSDDEYETCSEGPSTSRSRRYQENTNSENDQKVFAPSTTAQLTLPDNTVLNFRVTLDMNDLDKMLPGYTKNQLEEKLPVKKRISRASHKVSASSIGTGIIPHRSPRQQDVANPSEDETLASKSYLKDVNSFLFTDSSRTINILTPSMMSRNTTTSAAPMFQDYVEPDEDEPRKVEPKVSLRTRFRNTIEFASEEFAPFKLKPIAIENEISISSSKSVPTMPNAETCSKKTCTFFNKPEKKPEKKPCDCQSHAVNVSTSCCDANIKKYSRTPKADNEEKPDIVFMAFKACEEELKPIQTALASLKQELKTLNMPEVDCIFSKEEPIPEKPKMSFFQRKLKELNKVPERIDETAYAPDPSPKIRLILSPSPSKVSQGASGMRTKSKIKFKSQENETRSPEIISRTLYPYPPISTSPANRSCSAYSSNNAAGPNLGTARIISKTKIKISERPGSSSNQNCDPVCVSNRSSQIRTTPRIISKNTVKLPRTGSNTYSLKNRIMGTTAKIISKTTFVLPDRTESNTYQNYENSCSAYLGYGGQTMGTTRISSRTTCDLPHRTESNSYQNYDSTYNNSQMNYADQTTGTIRIASKTRIQYPQRTGSNFNQSCDSTCSINRNSEMEKSPRIFSTTKIKMPQRTNSNSYQNYNSAGSNYCNQQYNYADQNMGSSRRFPQTNDNSSYPSWDYYKYKAVSSRTPTMELEMQFPQNNNFDSAYHSYQNSSGCNYSGSSFQDQNQRPGSQTRVRMQMNDKGVQYTSSKGFRTSVRIMSSSHSLNPNLSGSERGGSGSSNVSNISCVSSEEFVCPATHHSPRECNKRGRKRKHASKASCASSSVSFCPFLEAMNSMIVVDEKPQKKGKHSKNNSCSKHFKKHLNYKPSKS